MEWSYSSIPKLQRCNRWSLGMNRSFPPTLYWTCDYLSMVGLKLYYVSKSGPRWPSWGGIPWFMSLIWEASILPQDSISLIYNHINLIFCLIGPHQRLLTLSTNQLSPLRTQGSLDTIHYLEWVFIWWCFYSYEDATWVIIDNCFDIPVMKKGLLSADYSCGQISIILC